MQKRASLALLGTVAALSLTSLKANAIVLDNFNGDLGFVSASGGPAGPKTATSGGAFPTSDVLGGYRILTVERTSSNSGQVSGDVNLSALQTFSYASGPSTTGKATLLYDNNGAGLGGVDITQGGAIALVGQYGSDLGAVFTFSVTDTANMTSTANLNVPGTGSSSTFTNFNIPFSSLSGVNLMSVKSISLLLDGSNTPDVDVSLRLLRFDIPTNVPEPGSVALLIGGALSGAVVLRRRRK